MNRLGPPITRKGYERRSRQLKDFFYATTTKGFRMESTPAEMKAAVDALEEEFRLPVSPWR